MGGGKGDGKWAGKGSIPHPAQNWETDQIHQSPDEKGSQEVSSPAATPSPVSKWKGRL